jgi:hypothetical protein
MSTVNVNRVVDASGGVLAPISSVMRNRIINGAMVIDQRNAGASVANIQGYSVDRWASFSIANSFSAQRSTVAPVGFTNSLLFTTTTSATPSASDYRFVGQFIEGFNVADLGWGTSDAKTVTVSFWVRSSLTGTFSAALKNGAETRSYPFSFTINAANTFEYKTVTVAGDTTGTWLTDNGIGLRLHFNLGSGSSRLGTAGAWAGSSLDGTTGSVALVETNGATFYITGVQLEVGTQATSFEYRQYQQELALCQRYYQTSYVSGTAVNSATGPTEGASFICINTSDSTNGGMLPVTMRGTPTFAMYSTVGGAGSPSVRDNVTGASVTGITLIGGITTSLPRLSKLGGLSTLGTPYSAHYTASAEL